MLTEVQYQILRKISPSVPNSCSGAVYAGKSKLAALFGEHFLCSVKGKSVIDIGCGDGSIALELAKHGASCVFGIDIRASVLEAAKQNAFAMDLQNTCQFGFSTDEPADIIISIDSFEHYSDPGAVLLNMNTLLKPGGKVFVAFGPTWYHPYGGHLFSVFPWAHLIFSESALIRWRSNFKTDGATTFCEVAGGLNQISIAAFENYVANSPLTIRDIELVPIRKFRFIHNRLTREFTTAVVKCQLQKRCEYPETVNENRRKAVTFTASGAA